MFLRLNQTGHTHLMCPEEGYIGRKWGTRRQLIGCGLHWREQREDEAPWSYSSETQCSLSPVTFIMTSSCCSLSTHIHICSCLFSIQTVWWTSINAAWPTCPACAGQITPRGEVASRSKLRSRPTCSPSPVSVSKAGALARAPAGGKTGRGRPLLAQMGNNMQLIGQRFIWQSNQQDLSGRTGFRHTMCWMFTRWDSVLFSVWVFGLTDALIHTQRSNSANEPIYTELMHQCFDVASENIPKHRGYWLDCDMTWDLVYIETSDDLIVLFILPVQAEECKWH